MKDLLRLLNILDQLFNNIIKQTNNKFKNRYNIIFFNNKRRVNNNKRNFKNQNF